MLVFNFLLRTLACLSRKASTSFALLPVVVSDSDLPPLFSVLLMEERLMYLACRRLQLLFNLRFSFCSESIMLFNDLIWFFGLLSSTLGSGDTNSLESSLYDNFREFPKFVEGIPMSSGSIHSCDRTGESNPSTSLASLNE